MTGEEYIVEVHLIERSRYNQPRVMSMDSCTFGDSLGNADKCFKGVQGALNRYPPTE